MKIPKRFKLFGTTVNVIFDNKKLDKEPSIGLSEHLKSTITLSDTYKGSKLSEDVIVDTFYHEKVHTILDAMGEHRLSNNEKFVEVFSRLLKQADETIEF